MSDIIQFKSGRGQTPGNLREQDLRGLSSKILLLIKFCRWSHHLHITYSLLKNVRRSAPKSQVPYVKTKNPLKIKRIFCVVVKNSVI